MEVYKAINAIQGELAKTGIGKDRQASSAGANFMFRGIDDVYNAIAPLLAKHALCILPRMVSREVAERKSSKGNALFYVTLEAEFDFVSAVDGSKHTVRTFGEAMDSGDKATNKAMSAAYKYAAFQTFAIPTESDADNVAHEVQPSEEISEEQLRELRDLVERTNTDLEPLCKFYKIDALPRLPAVRFEHCRRTLAKKLPEQKEAA